MTTEQELKELEKQIEAKQEEVQAPAVETPPAPEPTAPPETSESEPPQAAASESAPEFDASDWVKKKGWKTPEDAAKSLHSLEKAFHEKNEELKRLKDQQGQAVPPFMPGYPPPQPPEYMPPQGYPAPAAYAPPSNPYAPQSPRLSEEQVAASYGMTVEDFRRVLAVSKDMAEVQARQMATEFQRWKDEVMRTNEKNSDMTNAMSDPAFSNPDVQKEMHDLFSKNPSLWNERRPWTIALDRALTSIARRNLGTKGAAATPGMALPTDPPKTAGSQTASGSVPGKRGFGAMPTMRELEGKKPEEIERLLKGLNAVKTYEDLA